MALGLQPHVAVLNDTNRHLISFYRWLQKGLDPTASGVRFQNTQETFSAHRDRFNALTSLGQHDSLESAALFYYLNRTGFNGLCRFNRQGHFNVPFGRYSTIQYRDAAEFDAYRRVLEQYEFLHGDFADISVLPDDFVYSDPPYDGTFTQYSPGGFQWEDQIRLAQWLAGMRGPTVVSNQATDRILNLYRDLGFDVQTISAPRRISCNGDRAAVMEMLATKNI